eukprot:symbB.v1.2.037340.t1/scaffold5436.1/size50838/4
MTEAEAETKVEASAKGPAKGPGKGPAKGPAKGKGKRSAEVSQVAEGPQAQTPEIKEESEVKAKETKEGAEAPAAKGPAKGPGKGPAKGPAKGKGKRSAEAAPSAEEPKAEVQAPAAKGPGKGPRKGPAKGPAKGKGKSPAENSDESKMRRMSEMGMPTDQIAKVFTMDAAEVVKILERAERSTSKDQKRGYHPKDGKHGLDSMVKRLMTDPKDFCCPISHELMKDPVVAGDGHTYERSCIEGCLRTNANSPMTGAAITKVLHPNQHVKSSIMSFKENTVTEIMNVASGLAPELATKLLARAEEFVREQLPDGSARRKLSSLLLLKMKLPDINRNESIQEIVSLLAQIQDYGPLQQFLHEADESEQRALLPNLSEEMIASLCNAMQASPTSFKVLIEKEYVCRLASNLGDTERLKKMWDLLLANSMDEAGEWTMAAALVFAAFIDRLEAPLKELDKELLTFARAYLEARQDAVVFAEQFFKLDLGISTLPQWPPHGAGKILSHLAFQLSGEEKVQLLVEAQTLDREEAQSFKKRCEELERKCTDQQKAIEDLKRQQQKGVEDVRKKLQKRIEDLTQTCKELQQMSQTLQSFSWDLSGYDFSNFSKGQEKRSDKFQICSGVTAWISLYPKGNTNSSPGKAAVFLHVDKVVKVKFRFRAGQVDKTMEHDYSTSPLNADGTPHGRGWGDFIDSSAVRGASITLDVLSVQPANSSLKFLAPGTTV